MGASTLDEMNVATFNYIGGLLVGAYPTLFPTNDRIVFSVTADDESCIRRFEEVNQSSSKRVVLPAAAIIFEGFNEVTKKYGPRYQYASSNIQTGGVSDAGTFAPVQLKYRVRIFTNTMAELLQVMELWVLYISKNRLAHYHSHILGVEFTVEFVYEIPVMSTVPDIKERWGNKGYIYVMDVEFTGDGVIATAPDADSRMSRILSLISRYYIEGKETNFLEFIRTEMADMKNDQVTEVSDQ